MSCTKNFLIFPRLFSKFAHRLVAIKLLAFFTNSKFHIYYLREISVFGILKKIVCKQDWVFLLFVYTKSQIIRKKQDNLRNVFIYKNPDTLRYVVFHGIFEIVGGGGHFYMQKTMHFTLNFYMQKTMHFALRFLYIKAKTLCVTFLYAKNNALCVTFL